MSDKAKIIIIGMIENMVDVISFTILAIIFRHWWISLFSVLFLNIYKKEKDKKED